MRREENSNFKVENSKLQFKVQIFEFYIVFLHLAFCTLNYLKSQPLKPQASSLLLA
jgi:hypothetical protein